MKLTRFKQTQTGTCVLCCLAALSRNQLPLFAANWIPLDAVPAIAATFGLAAIPYPTLPSLPAGMFLAYLHHKTLLSHAILIDNREGDMIVYDPERPDRQLSYEDYWKTFQYSISALFYLQEAFPESDIIAADFHPDQPEELSDEWQF